MNDVIKYLGLPTWMLIKILVAGMPDHPYRTLYPTLQVWTYDSLPVLRIFDAGLWTLIVCAASHIITKLI